MRRFLVSIIISVARMTLIANLPAKGLEHDLGLKNFDYNIALTAFYIAVGFRL